MKQLRIVTGPTSEDLEKSVSSKFKPTVIGLFAGCGGMDYGFKLAGFNIVYANDFEKNVKQTYEKNVGPIHIEDICSVDKKQLPDCDVLVAGIPCQPFSNPSEKYSPVYNRKFHTPFNFHTPPGHAYLTSITGTIVPFFFHTPPSTPLFYTSHDRTMNQMSR